MTRGEYGHERLADDAYFTPAWCTETLLAAFDFSREILEPACGDGAISKILQRAGYVVESSDLYDYGFARSGINFIAGAGTDTASDIITNPPYDYVESFVRRSLGMTKFHKGRVAMLLRHEWDCAATRQHFFKTPFRAKLTLTKRPRWVNGTTVSPRFNFAWFVWDWNYIGEPVMYWGQ